MVYHGTVRNGVIEIDGGNGLPDGTRVNIQPIEAAAQDSSAELSLLAKLSLLENLAKDWNGYGSDPPSQVALKRAKRMLRLLASVDRLPLQISPSAEGGISFYFEGTRAYGIIEFCNDGTVDAMRCAAETIEETEIWEPDKTLEVPTILSRLD